MWCAFNRGRKKNTLRQWSELQPSELGYDDLLILQESSFLLDREKWIVSLFSTGCPYGDFV